jgi:hypothetical protein
MVPAPPHISPQQVFVLSRYYIWPQIQEWVACFLEQILQLAVAGVTSPIVCQGVQLLLLLLLVSHKLCAGGAIHV